MVFIDGQTSAGNATVRTCLRGPWREGDLCGVSQLRLITKISSGTTEWPALTHHAFLLGMRGTCHSSEHFPIH